MTACGLPAINRRGTAPAAASGLPRTTMFDMDGAMVFEREHDLERSRWSERTGRLIDAICLVVLVGVVATVIYGFALRAVWAHGYYIAVAVAIVGALVMMIGLAQQVIAARDAATWHDMAVWQLRAAREKIEGGAVVGASDTMSASDPDSPDYYEQLIKVFLESVQRTDGAALET